MSLFSVLFTNMGGIGTEDTVHGVVIILMACSDGRKLNHRRHVHSMLLFNEEESVYSGCASGSTQQLS